MRCFLPLLLILGTAVPAVAQNQPRGHYFLFVAPVTPNSADPVDATPLQLRSDDRLVHIAGGGEGKIADYFAFGTEFGGIPNATPTGGMTVISANGYFHLRGYRELRIDPFATVGYSGFFAQDRKTGGVNLGAGVNWWIRGGLGLTLELRRAYGANYREFRVGLSLRP